MNSLMIHPIYPTVPFRQFHGIDILDFFLFGIFLIMALLCAFLLSHYALEKWHGNKRKVMTAFICIAGIVAILLLCFFGLAVGTIKGIIFCLILTFSSYSDIKTREADDYLHIMIALTALIGTKMTDIPSMIFGAFMLVVPMIVITAFTKGKGVGGADIKLSAACGFLLGIQKGVLGLMLGLIFGIVFNIIRQKRIKQAEGFPFIPYLAAGYMAAYLI